MQGFADETVGSHFKLDELQEARNKTLQVILEASKAIKEGHTEADAKKIISDIQTQMGALKSWHPPQIRFGKNTLLPFGVLGDESVVLQPNDIFFFDIGPIFNGHEGDVGRAFVIGSDPEMKKCCQDVEAIWFEVRDRWFEQKCTGKELYEFAQNAAVKKGWELSLKKANGHRISDFPHAAKQRGSIEGFDQHPQANRWILEIQIKHPTRSFGAFYEDLLN